MGIDVAERPVTNRQRKTLAQHVRQLRDKAKLSQQDLAVKAGLSVSVISSIEQGKITDPRTSTLVKIAAALETTVEALWS